MTAAATRPGASRRRLSSGTAAKAMTAAAQSMRALRADQRDGDERREEGPQDAAGGGEREDAPGDAAGVADTGRRQPVRRTA